MWKKSTNGPKEIYIILFSQGVCSFNSVTWESFQSWSFSRALNSCHMTFFALPVMPEKKSGRSYRWFSIVLLSFLINDIILLLSMMIIICLFAEAIDASWNCHVQSGRFLVSLSQRLLPLLFDLEIKKVLRFVSYYMKSYCPAWESIEHGERMCWPRLYCSSVPDAHSLLVLRRVKHLAHVWAVNLKTVDFNWQPEYMTVRLIYRLLRCIFV